MTIICLLDLPLGLPADSPAHVHGGETFLTRLPQWISRCQTYEGGIADAPGNEAHGAYAFCGLACLSILGPPRIMSKYLDIGALIRWCSAQQHGPEGGFAGRTNKLVDGCYSHWVGGCWVLLHEALDHSPEFTRVVPTPAAGANTGDTRRATAAPAVRGGGASAGRVRTATEVPPGARTVELWSRDALARYALCCCQAPRGGMRDKPGKPPDAYHTCYVLAGLAGAQHSYEYRPVRRAGAEEVSGDGYEGDEDEEDSEENGGVQVSLSSAFNWRVTGTIDGCWTADDVVEPVHPIFVIAMDKVEAVRAKYPRNRNRGFGAA